MTHQISIINFHANDDILNAKRYMRDYKELLNTYNFDIGIIGRFFEKLFGTNKYKLIEKRLEYRYNKQKLVQNIQLFSYKYYFNNSNFLY